MTCFVKDCKTVRRLLSQESQITFHRFPTNEETFTKWLVAIGRQHENRVWKSTMFICSQHFRSEDFYTVGNKRCLKKNAYPSVNIPESGAKLVSETIKESVPGTSKEIVKESVPETSKSFEELNLLTVAPTFIIPKRKRRLSVSTDRTPSPHKTGNLGEPPGSDSSGSRKRRRFKLEHSYTVSPSTMKKETVDIRKKYIQQSSKLYRAR